MTGYVGSIEKQTLNNNYFRQVVFTGMSVGTSNAARRGQSKPARSRPFIPTRS